MHTYGIYTIQIPRFATSVTKGNSRIPDLDENLVCGPEIRPNPIRRVQSVEGLPFITLFGTVALKFKSPTFIWTKLYKKNFPF